MIDYSLHTNLQVCSERINDSAFWVRDTESGVCELCNESLAQLHVINNKELDVTLLKIDGCADSGMTGKRCDCSISTSSKIYFIEFKEKEDFSKKKSLRKSVQLAKKQLVETINSFAVYNLDLVNTHAVVALTPKLPHSYRKIVGTGTQSHIADFLSKTGCPNFDIGNIINL